MKLLNKRKLAFTIFILLFLVTKTSGQSIFDLQEEQIGCKTLSGSNCTEGCRLGEADCSTSDLKCEYGYFLFTNTELKTNQQQCVQCPYQAYDDKLSLMCMDCVENPYTWNTFRQCTYDYSILSGNSEDGTYIKQQRSKVELYYVGLAVNKGTQNTQNSNEIYIQSQQVYSTYQCSGCSKFCEPDYNNYSCQKVNNPYVTVDTDKIAVECGSGFAQLESKQKCYSCPEKCLTCGHLLDETSQQVTSYCDACQAGYYFDEGQQKCLACASGCSECYSQDDCFKCEEVDGQQRFLNEDYTGCESCGTKCSRCQLGYDKNGNQVKRCRQCSQSGYFIEAQGENCNPCNISNCSRCYQKIRTVDSVLETTLDIDFTPGDPSDKTTYCSRCEDGYYLSSDGLTCSEKQLIDAGSTIEGCSVYSYDGSTYTCEKCEDEDGDENLNQLYNGYCEYCDIENCKSCYGYFKLETVTRKDDTGTDMEDYTFNEYLFCLECEDGYYPDFFSSRCLKCDPDIEEIKCTQCSQYNSQYNFTDIVQNKPTLSLNERNKLQADEDDPVIVMCTGCGENFAYLSSTKQCIGCSEDCTIYDLATSESTSACKYTKSLAFCSQCQDSYLDRSLQSDLSKCHECPENCLACRERTEEEMQSTNPNFNPTNKEFLRYGRFCYHYKSNDWNPLFYDSSLNLPVYCSNTDSFQTKKCRKKLTLEAQLYCSKIEYDTAFATATNEEKLLIAYLDDFYPDKSNQDRVVIKFNGIQQDTYYEQWNNQGLQTLIFKIQFIKEVNQENCDFKKTSYFDSKIQQNVFSIKYFELHLNGQQSDGAALTTQLKDFLQFVKLTYIEIDSFVFLSQANSNDYGQAETKQFGIQLIDNNPATLAIKNCVFSGTEQKDVLLRIDLLNVESLILENVKIQKMRYDSSIYMFNRLYSVKKMSKQTIYINNLEFQNLDLLDQTIFIYNLVDVDYQKTEIGENGLSLKYSTLKNSKIFSTPSQNEYQVGHLDLRKLLVYNCTFYDSLVFRFDSLVQSLLQNVDVINTNFNYSYVFSLNSYEIREFYASQNTIVNQSSLIKSIRQLQVITEDILNSLESFHFENIHFSDNNCQNINCLMNIITPLNDYGRLANVYIKNLRVISTEITNIADKELNSINSALLYFIVLGNFYIEKFEAYDNFGITVFTLIDFEVAEFVDVIHEWKQQSILDNVMQSQNNKIPGSIDCADRKTNLLSYNHYFIYLSDFQNGIRFENVVIAKLNGINIIFIQIYSYDIAEQNTTRSNYNTKILPKDRNFWQENLQETIYFKNCKFISNSLSITESNTPVSSISIISNQEQVIKFEQMKFEDNHLHQLIATQTTQSTVAILVRSIGAQVYMHNSEFKQNRATQTDYGLVYIKAKSIKLSECEFKDTNMFDKSWLYRLEEDTLTQYDSQENVNEEMTIERLTSYFQIKSLGPNCYLNSFKIEIEKSKFENSHGVLGSGVYIQTIEDGEVKIKNTEFENNINSLEQSLLSEGGCLFVDSSESELNLLLEKVYMNNCIARTQGGCIMIFSSTQKQKVNITESQFFNCYAMKDAFLSAIFSDQSSEIPEVSIQQIQVLQEDKEYQKFINSIPEIDLSTLKISSAAYGQNYGNFKLQQAEFLNIQLGQSLQLTNMITVILSETNFIENVLIFLPLVEISLEQSHSNGYIRITKVSFLENKQYQYKLPTSIEEPTIKESTKIQEYTLDCKGIEQLVLENQRQETNENQEFVYVYIDEEAQFEEYLAIDHDSKYGWPYSDIFEEEFLVENLNYLKEAELTFKLLDGSDDSSVFEYYLRQYDQQLEPNEYRTSLIRINGLDELQYANFTAFTVENNECENCFGGLVQIINVNKNKEYMQVYLTDNHCYNNKMGYYGCFLITQEDIPVYKTFPFDLQDSFDPKQLDFNARLLTESEEEEEDNILNQLLENEYKVTVQYSTFAEGKSSIGTGISIIGLNSFFNSVLFADNVAQQLAAGIFFENNNNYFSGIKTETTYNQNSNFNITLYDIEFQGNKAQAASSIYLVDQSIGKPEKLNIYFTNNFVTEFGKNLAEYPSKLTLEFVKGQIFETVPKNEAVVRDSGVPIVDVVTFDEYLPMGFKQKTKYLILPTGQPISTYKYYYSETQEQVPYNYVFRITPLDRYGQPLENIEESSSCTILGRKMNIENPDETQVFNQDYIDKVTKFYFSKEKGAYDLDGLVLNFNPSIRDNYLQLKVTCDQVKVPVYKTASPYSFVQYNSDYSLYINVQTFDCQLGEYRSGDKCIACQEGDNTYAVTLDSKQCNGMNSETMEAVLPYKIKVKPDYWRPEDTIDDISYCRNLVDNCLGGWVPGDPSCYEGHIGGLCESCDLYGTRTGERWAQSAKYQCGKCSELSTQNSLIIVGISFLQAFDQNKLLLAHQFQ